MSAYAAAPQAYQQSSILTATPERLVVLLYDGANRFLRQAAKGMEAGRPDVANRGLQRAEAIIDELLVTLDLSAGEIAEALRDLYLFCRRLLNEARLERDAHKVGQVADLLGELRESWAQLAGA